MISAFFHFRGSTFIENGGMSLCRKNRCFLQGFLSGWSRVETLHGTGNW